MNTPLALPGVAYPSGGSNRLRSRAPKYFRFRPGVKRGKEWKSVLDGAGRRQGGAVARVAERGNLAPDPSWVAWNVGCIVVSNRKTPHLQPEIFG